MDHHEEKRTALSRSLSSSDSIITAISLGQDETAAFYDTQPRPQVPRELRVDLSPSVNEAASYTLFPEDLEAWYQPVAECNSEKNRLSNRSGYSPVQRVLGSARRLPGDLRSDDHTDSSVYRDLACIGTSYEEARLIREAATKGFASVSIRDRFDETVSARWRRLTEIFKQDVIMTVWRI